jgi:hypothetical protein
LIALIHRLTATLRVRELATTEGAPPTKEVDMIQVRRTGEGDPLEFEVVVREGKGETRHHVTMTRECGERLTAGKHTPERSLEAAFRFLLDREPKESILSHFDVTVISRYFPGLERELPRYLSQPDPGARCPFEAQTLSSPVLLEEDDRPPPTACLLAPYVVEAIVDGRQPKALRSRDASGHSAALLPPP